MINRDYHVPQRPANDVWMFRMSWMHFWCRWKVFLPNCQGALRGGAAPWMEGAANKEQPRVPQAHSKDSRSGMVSKIIQESSYHPASPQWWDWTEVRKPSQWVRVKAKEIREQPSMRLQRSLKVVPEQNRGGWGLGGVWKQGDKAPTKASWQSILKEFNIGHWHHFLCIYWIQAVKPQREEDELNALTLVTTTDEASLCLFWGWWKRTARCLVIIILKMS